MDQIHFSKIKIIIIIIILFYDILGISLGFSLLHIISMPGFLGYICMLQSYIALHHHDDIIRTIRASIALGLSKIRARCKAKVRAMAGLGTGLYVKVRQ